MPENMNFTGSLRSARCAFTACLAKLVEHAQNLGYEIALGRAVDPAKRKDPRTGVMKESLHNHGLAVDLHLYRESRYLDKTEDHEELGYYWEELGRSLGYPLAWGGRFQDGNHYSFKYRGLR